MIFIFLVLKTIKTTQEMIKDRKLLQTDLRRLRRRRQTRGDRRQADPQHIAGHEQVGNYRLISVRIRFCTKNEECVPIPMVGPFSSSAPITGIEFP